MASGGLLGRAPGQHPMAGHGAAGALVRPGRAGAGGARTLLHGRGAGALGCARGAEAGLCSAVRGQGMQGAARRNTGFRARRLSSGRTRCCARVPGRESRGEEREPNGREEGEESA